MTKGDLNWNLLHFQVRAQQWLNTAAAAANSITDTANPTAASSSTSYTDKVQQKQSSLDCGDLDFHGDTKSDRGPLHLDNDPSEKTQDVSDCNLRYLIASVTLNIFVLASA